MAIRYTAIELWQVKPILIQRGYRFNGNRNYGIQLTKASTTKRFRLTGAPYRDLLGGVSHQQLKQILLRSNSAEEAADQIEAICTGKQLVPEFQDDRVVAPQLNDKLIEQIVQNRTENVIAQKTAQQEKRILELQAQIEALEARASQPAPVQEKKKPGRPKGSKNKAKPVAVPRGTDVLDDVELTEEQEEMLRKLNFGPANE